MNADAARTTGRARRAAERRLQLLTSALALFAERGFENTSMKDLAAAAGVAPGLAYHYFRSKEELLFAALEEQSFLPELRRRLPVAPDRPAGQVLPELAHAFHALLVERDSLLRVVARESQTDPRMAAALQRVIEGAAGLLRAYLDARVAAGELRPHDTDVTARTLFQTIVMLRLTRTPAEAFLPTFLETLLRGTAAAPNDAAGGDA
jgi:AcrR family transcriptional regulator